MQLDELQNLEQYLQSRVRDDVLSKELFEYAEKLASQGLPVIYGIPSLGKYIGIKDSIIGTMVAAPEKYYRSFSIPKRTPGETRQIDAPYPVLLETQRWIAKTILGQLALHESAHGYVCGKSIRTNALAHLQRESLLKIDIKDYFPSITFPRVFGLFKSFAYSNHVSFILSRLCTLRGATPQGAATSPSISNLISRKMDLRLAGFARKYDYTYTRYADDIFISGNGITVAQMKFACAMIESEGFSPHPNKIRLIRSGRRVITGISVASGKIKILRETKREWRAEIHSLITLGMEIHCTKYGYSPLGYKQRILGRLAFWRYVEPDNTFVEWASTEMPKLA